MITCAINDPKIIRLLYADVTSALNSTPAGQKFDHNAYMQNLFTELAENTSQETAAKFLQSVPRLIIDAQNTFFEDTEIDPVALYALRNDFKKDDAISSIINLLSNNANIDVLKGLAELAQDNKSQVIEMPIAPETEATESFRFKTLSPFGGTLQNYIAINPDAKVNQVDGTVVIEDIDPEKINAIKFFENIKVAQGMSNVTDGVVINGVKLYFKPQQLDQFATGTNYDKLDNATKNEITASRKIRKEAKEVNPNIIQADKRIILLVTDEFGNPVYADAEGNLVDESEGGKLIYQFMRTVRKIGPSYTVRNIYDNADLILSPEEFVKGNYNPKTDGSEKEYLATIKKFQLAEIKKLYDLQEKILKGDQELLPITGISTGVDSSQSSTNIPLKDLLKAPGISENILSSIKSDSKGYATITVNGSVFNLDRLFMTNEIANEIATILLDPTLTKDVKKTFIDQFLPGTFDPDGFTRRYNIIYGKDKDFIYFNMYNNFGKSDKTAIKKPDSSILISKAQFEKSTPEKLAIDKQTIIEYLTQSGLPLVGKRTRMSISNKALKNRTYLRLSPTGKGFVNKPYLDLIKENEAEVKIINADPGFYNYILNFTTNDSLLGDVINNTTKAGPIKQLKDTVVQNLKEGQEITGTINKDYTKDTLWDIITPTEIISFYNYGAQKLTDTDKNKTVSLFLNPKVIGKDGQTYYDVVEVYLDDVHVGNVAETDYTIDDQVKNQNLSEASVVQEIINPGAESPTAIDTPVNKIFDADGGIDIFGIPGFLNRSDIKKEFINPVKILQAKRWWNSKELAPLRSVISLEHIANIVNSDVYATFITSGAMLADGNLGSIKVNKANGTFYQNLTAYHEAWHVFSQLFLTKSDKLALYEELRNSSDAAGNKPHINKTYRELEEILAEDFRNYVKTGKAKQAAPKRNTFFARILKALQQFFGKVLKKFRKADVEIDSLNSPLAKELFDNLYLGKFNSYQASIDNAMMFSLDRGVTLVASPKQTALSPQDSMEVVDSIDSIFSEIIDEIYKQTISNQDKIALMKAVKNNEQDLSKDVLEKYKPSGKEETILMLTEPNKRAWMYAEARKRFAKALLSEEAKIVKTKNAIDFANIKSIEELKRNSVAVLKSKTGRNKYFFLTSQVNDYSKLTPTYKNGERIKGEDYKGAVKIIGDYYRYMDIGTKKEPADIIIVSRLEDVENQYQNYIKADAKVYTGVERNKNAQDLILTEDQELIRDNVRILQRALLEWGDEKSGVIKYHMDNSDYELGKTKYEIDIDDSLESTEFNTEELNNDTKTGKVSLQEMMSKETTYLLKSLFKINPDGTTPVNKLGFKKRADFATVFTIVSKAIGGERDRYVAYEKLGKEAEKFPEIKQLYDTKYPNPSNIKNIYEYSISRQFLQDFGKYKIKYMQLFAYTDEQGLNFQVKESSLAIDNTLNRWSGGFSSSSKTKYIDKTSDNVSELNLNSVIKEFDKNGKLDPKKSLQFLKAIGIDMQNNDNINNELINNSEYYGLPYIYDIVKDFNDLNQLNKNNPNSAELNVTKITFLNKFIVNPIETLRNPIPSGVLKNLKGTVKELTQLKRLAELQTKYGYDSATTGVIRANGNTGYQDMNWSTIVAKVYALNAATNMKELWSDSRYDYMSYLDPLINPHTRHLKLLNNLYDANGKKNSKKNIQLIAPDGFSKTNPDGSNEGNTTTELDPFSKFLLELHSMTLGGVSELPRTSEKKFSYGIKLSGGISTDPVGYETKGDDIDLYVDMNKFFPQAGKNETGSMFAIGSYFFGYIQGEFDRIKKFRGPDKAKYLTLTGFNQMEDDGNGNEEVSGALFSAFDSMLRQETKNQLYKLADEQFQGDLINNLELPLKKAIVKDILDYFNEKTKEIKELYFDKFGYISRSLYVKAGYKEEDLTPAKMKELGKDSELTSKIIKTYLYNDWIHKYEVSMLLFGDHAQWNHNNQDWSKRIPGLTSDGTGFLFDKGTVDIMQDVINKNTYAALLQKNTGIAYDNFVYSQKLNTAVIQDAVRESIYLDDMIDAWEEEYSKTYDSATVKKLIANDRKAYTDMKEGDGMAYMTLDAYRALHYTGGKGWSLAQEELYQKIINGIEVDTAKVRDYFPVYKLHYFGAIDNDIYPATAMHKFAVIPLIPGVNAKEGSQLDVLNKKMLKENIQYTTFESGSKGSNLTQDGKVDNIFIDDAKAINQKLDEQGYPEVPFTKNTIYLANLKEVTVINNHWKKQLPIASQTRGIVIDNLYKDGKIINEKNKELLDTYSQTVQDYTSVLKDELLNNIGFELIDGRYVGNLTEFVKLIRDQLTQRDTPDHLIKLINTTDDNQLAMDLSLHPESDSIEKLLMSFIQRGLIKQNTNGEPLVQTPTTFTNGLWDSQFKNIKETSEIKKLLGTNTLPYYIRNKNNRSGEMKVAIAIQGDFFKLLKAKDNEGNVIGTLTRLNELLKDPIWSKENKDAITIFGPRIPNDATNTIEAAEIWHFLPESFSNSIIIPTEIVGKAGSDYDGDKLFMSMPNLTSDGQFIKSGVDNYKTLLKETKDLEKEGKLPKDRMSSAKIINIQKKFLQNKYLKTATDILMLPENYAFLTKPNGTYLVDIYTETLEKNNKGYNRYNNPLQASPKQSIKNEKGVSKTVMSPTRAFEQIHNLFVHDANLSLEPSLGILAKLAKSHPIYKAAGAKMPAEYVIPVYNFETESYIEDNESMSVPVIMRFKHNTVKNSDGKTVISLAGEKTQKGTRISDLISHNLQGILDRAKQSFPFDLKLIPEAMDVLSYMIQAGVNEEDIFLFLNQPLIVKYFENQILKNSSMFKALNPAPKSSIKNASANEVINSVLNNLTKTDRAAVLTAINKEKLKATIDFLKLNNSNENLKIVVQKGKSFKGTAQELANALNNRKIKAEDIESILLNRSGYYEKTKQLTTNNTYYYATKILSQNYLKGDITTKDLTEGLESSDSSSMKALAIFMNYIELEKQFSGMTDLQTAFSPDTAKLTTVQQILKRLDKYFELTQNSKIDKAFLENLMENSIISSFNQDKLIKDLITPLFALRLNNTVTDYIKNLFSNYNLSKSIKNKFGKGVEGEERFTNIFNNMVVNFIFQNYRSNSSNAQGELVNIPETFNSKEIIINDDLFTDVVASDKNITINSKIIEQDYNDQVFIASSTSPNSYSLRGLDTFAITQNPFNNLASYYHYVIAREEIRFNTPVAELEKNKYFMTKALDAGSFDVAYESYISEKALKNSFNNKYIMGGTKYSYSETVMNTINEFGDILKVKYPFLSQLSLAPNVEAAKVLQLNNKKEAQGDLASFYYKDIRDLADISVYKVNNPEDNKRITEVFSKFSLFMYYQHGVGNSKLSFVKVLDPSVYKRLIMSDSTDFRDNYLSVEVLDSIKNIVLNNSRFKNLVVEPQAPRNESIDNKVPVNIISTTQPNLIKGELVVFKEDVNNFINYINKSKGVKPEFFFTANTTFKAFYNSSLGRRDVMPMSARWELQGNGLYNMVDQDPDSAEVYYENVDLTTGFQMIDPKALVADELDENTVKVAAGILIIKNSITPSEELELFNELKPYLEAQGSQTNKGTSAPIMIGLGLRWDYTSNNPGKTPVEVGEIINNTSYQKNKYRYYDVAYNGQPLGQISQRLKNLVTKATGVDTTNYDGAIINVYPKNSFISAHNDVDESVTAINYPVLVLNIGGSGNLSIEGAESQKTKKAYNDKEYVNTPLQSGDAYIFGEKGVNRDVYHRTVPSIIEGTLPELNIQGKIVPANSYRLTITLRRVMPLEPGMPKAPANLSTTQPSTSVEEGNINLSNQQKIDNLRAQERADVLAAIPNIGEYPDTYGKKQSNMPDSLYAIYKPIYDRYDKLITPLLKAQSDKKDLDAITEDMAVFNQLVEANKGALPKTFTVGRRNWILNPFGNYDLVSDETGEIFTRNINMETGEVMKEPGLNDPIDPIVKAEGLIYLESMQDQLAEQLAELGYDIKDLLNNLAKAKTVEDYNKIQEILNKLC